eukprot:EG_transcript_11111
MVALWSNVFPTLTPKAKSQCREDRPPCSVPADVAFHIAKYSVLYREVLACALVCKAWCAAVQPILLGAAHILQPLNTGAYDDTVLWESRVAEMGGASWKRPDASPFHLSCILTPLIPDVLFDLSELRSKFSIFRALPNAWKCGVLYFDGHGILPTLNIVGTLFNRRDLFAGPTLQLDLDWVYRLRPFLDEAFYNGLSERFGIAPCIFASAAVLQAKQRKDGDGDDPTSSPPRFPGTGEGALPWPQFESAVGQQFLNTLGLHLRALQDPWTNEPAYAMTRLSAPYPPGPLEGLLDVIVTKRQVALVEMFAAETSCFVQLRIGRDVAHPVVVLCIGRLRSTGSLVGFVVTARS